MHAQPNSKHPSTEDATYDALVLDLLLIEHDGLWSVAELQQMLGNEPAVEDALARLHGLGLIHRIENLVCATRAAAHMRALAN
jgi:hypothetical protein